MYHKAIVIDDNRLERFLAEKLIAKYQFAEQVMSFSSAVDGLSYLQSLGNDPASFPEIIFLDIHMPLMTGFEFMDKYLEFPQDIKDHCKIVLFSSTDAYIDHIRMKNYPIIYKFLRKPLSEEKLSSLQSL
jgi:two-component SAPR family response regulator